MINAFLLAFLGRLAWLYRQQCARITWSAVLFSWGHCHPAGQSFPRARIRRSSPHAACTLLLARAEPFPLMLGWVLPNIYLNIYIQEGAILSPSHLVYRGAPHPRLAIALRERSCGPWSAGYGLQNVTWSRILPGIYNHNVHRHGGWERDSASRVLGNANVDLIAF